MAPVKLIDVLPVLPEFQRWWRRYNK